MKPGNMTAVALALAATCLAAPALGASATRPAPALHDAKPVSLVVDTSKRYQTLEGFGAAITWYGNWLTRNSFKDEVYALLWRDLGLDILRLRNTYGYNGDDTVAEGETDQEVTAAASEYLGRPVSILLTSWSPGPALKSNGETGNGGTLMKKDGAFDYDGFANHWADSLKAYADLGIKPDYASIQNEPDFKAEWDACLLADRANNETAGYGKALEAVLKRIGDTPGSPKFIGPECIGIGYSSVQNYSRAIKKDQVYALAHHLYHGGEKNKPDSFLKDMKAVAKLWPDKPKFQTEYSDGKAFEIAWLMQNALTVEGVSAWLNWPAVWAEGADNQALVQMENPDASGTWKSDKGYIVGDHFYSMKHFSRFTDPGYARVDAVSSNDAIRSSAFVSPDGKRLTVVLTNTSGSQGYDVSPTLQGFDASKAVWYRSIDSEKGFTERMHPWGDGKAPATVQMPPRSLVTVVYDIG